MESLKVIKNIQPIFIMGAPRSGTTLLAGMLSNRSDALALPEMHYLHDLFRYEMIFGQNRKKIFNTLKDHFMFRDIDIVSNDEELELLISDSMVGTVANILNKYNEKYLKKEFQIWIEHTPHNHKYFDEWSYYYPDAKFIHILRDGRAVYRSTKEVDWGYKDVITGAKNWNKNVIDCLIKGKAFSDKVYTLKYEDLTSDCEKYLKEICEFLKIDYQENMLVSGGIRKPGYANYAKDLGEKANMKSQNTWIENLSKRDIEHFTEYNYDILKCYNYDVDGFRKKNISGFMWYFVKITGMIKHYYFWKKSRKRFKDSVRI